MWIVFKIPKYCIKSMWYVLKYIITQKIRNYVSEIQYVTCVLKMNTGQKDIKLLE